MNSLWIKLMSRLSLADIVLVILHGRVQVQRGTVRPGLLSELGELVQHTHIENGCIQARIASSSIRLSFFGIPEKFHQRFRNVWSANWK